ncbi:MAG TPA: hypothetical protein DCM68_05600 [Verrucomicrobia bacterium]|nr:hypothetical protein [Verrucomicrobiota bacterium]
MWLALALPGFAQTFKLGLFEFLLTARTELGYQSNVDGAYPEEEDPNYQKGDFYWMPGVSMQSSSVGMRPSTTFNLSGSYEYMDYFKRNDEDTELYDFNVTFQTAHPRLTLGGNGLISYEIESEQDTYRPGGSKRDPMMTQEGSVFANWNYGKFRLEGNADHTRERHDKEEYRADDQDETLLFAGVFLDLFTWGSLYYSWENDVTTMVETEEETDEITENFGISGTIPLSWLARPKITYSFGFESEDVDTGEGEDKGATWEPTHTLTVMDEFQLSKSLHLAMSATWEDTWTDDEISWTTPSGEVATDEEVTFEYNVQLTHQLSPRAQHALTFTQEPQETFGSTADTETTTFGYNFGIKDLILYGLSFAFSAEYELSTPLGEEDAETEKTTTFDVSLNHSRQLSRRLSRNLTYTYSWENTNFHDDGAMEEHEVIYGFAYAF